jgi:hypothetical protein
VRRLIAVALLALCAALALATTPSYAAYVLRMTVNADSSVTIQWALGSTGVSNVAVAVDCCVVHTWFGADRSTTFTTEPLSAGRHTIQIQALERYWSNTYYDPASCEPSTRASFRWSCSRTAWTAPMAVVVPSSRHALCVVPAVGGLRLKDAKARITLARCSLGAVMRKDSSRPIGTVIGQRPKESVRLAKGATVALVVSNGRSPTRSAARH